MTKKVSFAFYLLFMVSSIYAQQPVKQSGYNLNQQFQNLKNQSFTFQEFKSINMVSLDSFWNTVQDSLQKTRTDFATSQKQIITQQKEIALLKKGVAERDQQLQKNDYESSRVSVLGIPVLKVGYVWFSFFVFAGLITLLGIIFVKYQSSHSVIASTRRDYDEAKMQEENLRKRILEVQTQLGRDLQNERVKVEELKSKLALNK